jgi:hypothetical protein
MLRAALKILAYLSILTSTRTSSSYLEPPSSQSYASYRNTAAVPQQQIARPDTDTIDAADVFEWRTMSNSETPYFIPRLVNTNNMLYTQLSYSNSNSNSNSNNNSNNRRGSKKARKNKKQQQLMGDNSSSKQIYENFSKRKSDLSAEPQVTSHSNNQTTNLTTSNEYPTTQVDPQHERELQELFGIDGAKKYQEYQLQQQIFGKSQSPPPSDAAAAVVATSTDIKDPVKKRDGAAEEMQDVSGAMINQMMSRTTRRQREYDVPLIRE